MVGGGAALRRFALLRIFFLFWMMASSSIPISVSEIESVDARMLCKKFAEDGDADVRCTPSEV